MEEFICPDGLGNHFPFLIQKNLEAIEKAFELEISLRGNKVMYSGNGAQAASSRSTCSTWCCCTRRTASSRTMTSSSA